MAMREHPNWKDAGNVPAACQCPCPSPRVLLKGAGWGGPKEGGGGGGGWGGNPPPAGDPELLEAPKAPKKSFGLNCLASKTAEKIFDWPKTRRKICPIT